MQPVSRQKNQTMTQTHRVSRHSTQDSAPKGPIPTFFKRVHPVNEPLSRYGNPATYHVDGQRYAVLKTANGYKQRGLASWYGTKFHSQRTSSGDPYNMYELTAAHKTLPLPTYVKVKNLDNGRVAIVKVNDRGPFHTGRIIDLSYGAAVKLGIFPKGTARVEIETVREKNAAIPQVAHYYIQAGAFSSKSLAEQLQRKLARSSSSPVFIKQENQHYLVRLGPLKDKKIMEQLKASLVNQGVNGFSLLL
ncbi:MAG: septal ring lytic transglycosylase RlpA family lipoprotein [Legionella sp.]|nr:MAG: septal ring lytic transglycosylase RlpA family lipoprotein [Legionella sp.]